MKQFIHTYDNIITIEKLLKAWRNFARQKAENLICFKPDWWTIYFLLMAKNKTYAWKYHAFNTPLSREIFIKQLCEIDYFIMLYIGFHIRILIANLFLTHILTGWIKGTIKLWIGFDFLTKFLKQYTNLLGAKCEHQKILCQYWPRCFEKILSKYLLTQRSLASFSSYRQLFFFKHIYAIADICKIGLPLTNLTSQLLVNIYMNEFDQFMKRVKSKILY